MGRMRMGRSMMTHNVNDLLKGEAEGEVDRFTVVEHGTLQAVNFVISYHIISYHHLSSVFSPHYHHHRHQSSIINIINIISTYCNQSPGSSHEGVFFLVVRLQSDLILSLS